MGDSFHEQPRHREMPHHFTGSLNPFHEQSGPSEMPHQLAKCHASSLHRITSPNSSYTSLKVHLTNDHFATTILSPCLTASRGHKLSVTSTSEV
ncbi:hypothetical protein GOBAR_DD19711 [Gossypium barbadense]|nr:hypothetical protein GOBAR_DD19711 [Gossypium barbadense]